MYILVHMHVRAVNIFPFMHMLAMKLTEQSHETMRTRAMPRVRQNFSYSFCVLQIGNLN